MSTDAATHRSSNLVPVELSPFRSPAAWTAFLLPFVTGLILDQATKRWAFDRLLIDLHPTPDGRYRPESFVNEFIPGWLHFEVTVNQGAVFGLGQGQRILFVLVSVGAIYLLGHMFARSAGQRSYQIVLGMLLAGVLGNLYDRITYGYVRDMIHAVPRWGIFPWIFNVADTLLCVGVALIVAHNLWQAVAGKKPPASPSTV